MKLQIRVALAIAVLALVSALSGVGGAFATKQFIITSSAQLAPGVVKSSDIHRNAVKTTDLAKSAVRSSDLAKSAVRSADLATNSVRSTDLAADSVESAELGNGTVQSVDIGADQVQPSDLGLPAAEQVVAPGAAVGQVGEEFSLVTTLDSYAKVDPTTALEVVWNGSAEAGFSPCQFQIRVDGQPPVAGAAIAYVQNGSINGAVTRTGLFSGLTAGPHEVQIWARSTTPGGPFPCTVGPDAAGIAQSVSYTELVS